MKISLAPNPRRHLAHPPQAPRHALGKAIGAILTVWRFLDRNFVRILKFGALGLLFTLLVISQVNAMTWTDADAAAGVRANTIATSPTAPAAPVAPTAPAEVAPAPGGSATYEVAAGDTLAGIAVRHRVGYRQIAGEQLRVRP